MLKPKVYHAMSITPHDMKVKYCLRNLTSNRAKNVRFVLRNNVIKSKGFILIGALRKVPIIRTVYTHISCIQVKSVNCQNILKTEAFHRITRKRLGTMNIHIFNFMSIWPVIAEISCCRKLRWLV